MKRTTTFALSLVAFMGATYGGTRGMQSQTTQSSPAGTKDPGTTIRSEVRLVVVDVTVVDANGKPVKGLKADQFRLKEDGVLQNIRSVESHESGGSEPTPLAPLPSGDGTTTLTNRPPDSATVWNVLLVDLLDTQPGHQSAARQYIARFVKQVPANEPLALAAMASHVKVLVPFHAGSAGIDKALRGDSLSPTNPTLQSLYNSDDYDLMAHMVPNVQFQKTVSGNMSDIDSGRQELRIQTALGSLSAIAGWLKKYPGRKNVYWISSRFPDLRNSGEFNLAREQLAKELESARIAIYPVDVSGINMGDAPILSGAYSGGSGFVRNAPALSDAAINDDSVKGLEKAEMLGIAQETGGVARFNNNDEVQILLDDFKQSQNYYTVAYSPSHSNWNGAYRKLELSLDTKGYHLAYRRGYYAKDAPPEDKPTNDQFTIALRPGAPPETAVLFSAKLKKSQEGIAVEYAIDRHTLQFKPDPSGKFVAEVDCAIVEYDSSGKPLGLSQIRVTGKITQEQLAGTDLFVFPAKQTVPLKPGAESLALGVRDQSTGRFGNLQVALTAPAANITPAAGTTPTAK